MRRGGGGDSFAVVVASLSYPTGPRGGARQLRIILCVCVKVAAQSAWPRPVERGVLSDPLGAGRRASTLSCLGRY